MPILFAHAMPGMTYEIFGFSAEFGERFCHVVLF